MTEMKEMAEMSWTDERVETLKKLWNDGLSASQIAAELGGVTRNAVIGKVHRLGLSGRAKPARSNAPKARTSRQPGIVHRKTRVVTATRGNTAIKAELQPEVASIPAPVIELPPVSRRLSISNLTERTCRWPIGDPSSEDFHFCGCDSEPGSPYCSYHSRIAFQPATQRRKVANG